MFKIGEFSNLVRVSARMLRYYEQHGLLTPAAIDRASGYRWYSAEQIPLLSRITAFREMGFSIEETRELLARFEDAEFVRHALLHKHRQIQEDIADRQGKLSLLMQFSRGLREKERNMVYDVELKSLPAVKVLSLRDVIPAYDHEEQLWHRLGMYMAHHGISCPKGGYSIYPDDEYKESDVTVEVAVPVDAPPERAGEGADQGEFVYKELSAIPLAATIRFSGPYDGGYTQAMEMLGLYLEQNGYEMAGSMRGEALAGAQDQCDSEHFLTELQVPVRKR